MQSVIDFMVANKVMVLSVVYVVLNEVSAFMPSLQNNGIVGSLLQILKSLGAVDPAKK